MYSNAAASLHHLLPGVEPGFKRRGRGTDEVKKSLFKQTTGDFFSSYNPLVIVELSFMNKSVI
jgi:hypothetical protein